MFLLTNTITRRQLTRETITKAVSRVTRMVLEEISSKPNITSRSFLIVYISQLWKNSKRPY